MAEEFEFLFTVKQIEALVRALEECGANSGNYRSMIERFRDPELANAAKSAHSLLRRKGQKQARNRGASDPIRELHKDSAREDLKAAYLALKNDHVELITGVDQLLLGMLQAKAALSSGLEPERSPRERGAFEHLDNALRVAATGDTVISHRLWDFENGGRG